MAQSHREAGEQFAVILIDHGMQRMNARVMAAFLVTEQETLTQGEIAKELGAAAGSVSGAVKLLINIGLLERVPAAGSRRDHYRLRDDAWETLFSRQNQAIEAMLTAARKAIEVTRDGGAARRRLEIMCDFHESMLAELRVLIERWKRTK